VPNLLTLHARYDAKHRTAILRGSLRSAGKPRARVRVVFTSLIRKVTPHGVEYHDAYAGSTRTNAAGAFLIRKKIKRTTGFLATAASTISACTGTSTAPAGCLSATTAGTRSEPITVSVPGR